MREEQFFSFPDCLMFDDDDFSEFDDLDSEDEEGDVEGIDNEEMIDEEKTDWEEEM
jgi:hypothetical protein